MSSISGRSIPRLSCTSALLAAVLALGGCMARSVAPVVGARDRVFDGRLVGTWQGDGKETAVVSARDSEYLVVYRESDGKSGRFVGRLGRLGTRWVLDLSPDDSGLQASDSYKGLMLPLHTFLLIDSIGGQIRAWGVKSDSIEAYLRREPTAIAHVKVSDDVLLTATTDQLRVFLERFATYPGVLEPAVWTRR